MLLVNLITLFPEDGVAITEDFYSIQKKALNN